MNRLSKTVAILGTRGYPSYYGGFETAVRRLAPYLADQGWNVIVYGRPGSTVDAEADPRVQSVVTSGLDTKSISTLSYGLSSAVDAARRAPDVALVMNVANGFWLPLLKRRGIPTLVNVDGIEWDRAKWGRLAKFIFRRGARATAKHASRLVFDAIAIGDRWKSDFNRDGAFIPYGGDVPPPSEPVDGLTHRGYALMVARFVPENSIVEFLEAARIIARQWDVVIVGSTGYGGELDDEVARLSAENERVTWLGHVSDDAKLHSLWEHAGVYFHGHSVGGTNPALVQAMACAAPVVARDTIYNREVLGPLGAFVAPDGAAIAAELERVLRSPEEQQRLSDEASRRAASTYTWEAVCAAYDAELTALMHRP